MSFREFLCLIVIIPLCLTQTLGCSSNDQEFSYRFMSYCLDDTRTEIDNIGQMTDWFPGSPSNCDSAFKCVKARLSVDEREYENTFLKLVGEYSDPMADLIVQCVDPQVWSAVIAQRSGSQG